MPTLSALSFHHNQPASPSGDPFESAGPLSNKALPRWNSPSGPYPAELPGSRTVSHREVSRLAAICLDSYTFQSENFLLRLYKYPLPSREGIKGRGMPSGFHPHPHPPPSKGEGTGSKFQISLARDFPAIITPPHQTLGSYRCPRCLRP